MKTVMFDPMDLATSNNDGGTSEAGSWLKRAIEDHEMTQTDFAERVGVSRITVTNWVRNHKRPKGINLVRIARVLDVSREHVERQMGLTAAA